jgi:hypothetical protein
MTPRLEASLNHARAAGKLYGMDILANSLALLAEARIWALSHENEMDLSEAWGEVGDDLIGDDARQTMGHDSERNIAVMATECQALIEVLLEECGDEDPERILKRG